MSATKIAQAAVKKLTAKKVAAGAVSATGLAYINADENEKETIQDIAVLGGSLIGGAALTKQAGKVINKYYGRKGGSTTAKVMQGSDINMPGFYGGWGQAGQAVAVGKEAVNMGSRLTNQFFRLGDSAGTKLTGLGKATQESIDTANRARLVANEAGNKWLAGVDDVGGGKELVKMFGGKSYKNLLWNGKRVTPEQLIKLRAKSSYNKLPEMKEYRKARKIAHYNIEKDYMMLKKAGRPIPGPLESYIKPFLSEATEGKVTRTVGRDKMNLIKERWDKELSGTFSGKNTKFFLNKNTNPDSVNWDMMKDPVYHNLMVDLQNKPGGKGLYFTLDDLMDYGKEKGLNMRRTKSGSVLLDYSPEAKSNYLKGGTRAIVEFKQSGRRVRPEFVNSDVFDLFGAPIGDNTIIISEPYRPGLKAINFLKKEPKAYGSGARKDLKKVPQPENKLYDVDLRFANFKPKEFISEQNRKVMDDINLMAKDATKNYTTKMDPDLKERLLRRATAGVAMGLPVSYGIYGLFDED